MSERKVGILGASSLVGGYLLAQLEEMRWSAIAFSREKRLAIQGGTVEWRQLPEPGMKSMEITCPISHWICVAPIWVLPDYFSLIEASGARRLVALSSTSRFTKVGSDDTAENAIAAKLIESEAQVQAWAEGRGIEWVVLRPTLIYGQGRDKNISEMARFIRRFGFFPLLDSAQGLRQPIHAEDVAAACVAALPVPDAASRAYNLSGGETLTYREMVARVFTALGRPARLVTVPLWAFRLAVAMMRRLPRYRHWSAAMAERMKRDLVFDHTDAARDLGFKPRSFALMAEDVPQ
ncbi:NAD-dependent epimerase/dehydratase family protein [Laribacter hongkongensis]|uniref:NAD-dependent epimerase/dehydratase family protein n=1 Tax=Laribacter hongkongensis TaxID=168471 RepID=UPI001EFE56FB|nr:NAD-dependent epimerase/dehydratase family protein [Laribacter hongkongensis]MCG9033000.1 NAD-dependent epimerase/dehydratase family protein [Laribacter hongkongensis]MCG9093086.1 NAD-dependent epimerase/dehydratase family protein [Laribacter hongkongensis]